ncbi:MAG: hypothetical protein IJW20_04645 [Clostridia bacterium]|nr:hypothetical protein [Clostridia bacterium]
MTKRDERTFRELNDSIDTWIVIAIMLVVRFGIPYAIGYYGNMIIAGGSTEENRMIASAFMFGSVIIGRIIEAIVNHIRLIKEDRI